MVHVIPVVDRIMKQVFTKIIWKKTDPSEIERTYNIRKKQIRFSSLFMRYNGKCNHSHAPSTGLSSILLFIRIQYS